MPNLAYVLMNPRAPWLRCNVEYNRKNDYKQLLHILLGQPNVQSHALKGGVLFYSADNGTHPVNAMAQALVKLMSIDPDVPRVTGSALYVSTDEKGQPKPLSREVLQTVHGIYEGVMGIVPGPKRARPAHTFWASYFHKVLKLQIMEREQITLNFQEANARSLLEWNKLTPEEKKPYEQQADDDAKALQERRQEYEKKNRKPPKHARSAFQFFTAKRLPNQDKPTREDWVNLPEAEKQQLQDQAAEDLQRYQQQYDQYVLWCQEAGVVAEAPKNSKRKKPEEKAASAPTDAAPAPTKKRRVAQPTTTENGAPVKKRAKAQKKVEEPVVHSEAIAVQ